VAVSNEDSGPAGVARLLGEAQAQAAGARGHLGAEEVDLAAAVPCDIHSRCLESHTTVSTVQK